MKDFPDASPSGRCRHLLTEGGMSEISAIKGPRLRLICSTKLIEQFHAFTFATKVLEKMAGPNQLSYTSKLEDFLPLFGSIE
jgi:hypothetical protein